MPKLEELLKDAGKKFGAVRVLVTISDLHLMACWISVAILSDASCDQARSAWM